MEIIKEFITNFFVLANAMSLYILVGLLIAGVLKEFLPSDFVSKHLGKSSFGSVIKATILGIPMPVCSCSVVPLAKGLQKEGASKGAVSSFLISTPITGVDSMLATYGFFGMFFTIYRVLTSIVMAIVTGVLQNIFDKKIEVVKPKFVKPTNFSIAKPMVNKESESCCSSGSCCDSKVEKSHIKNIFNYAFNTLFKDIVKSLFIGLVIGALFTTFLPKELLSSLGENHLLTYILVLVIAMPLYVCATSSLPIGASLLMSGLSSGAVFVFLSAGPATNSVTMKVVYDMFGRVGFGIYMISIALFSIAFGFLFDSVFKDIDVLSVVNHDEESGYLTIAATILMLALMVYYYFKKK